jgi:hypothetical protein
MTALTAELTIGMGTIGTLGRVTSVSDIGRLIIRHMVTKNQMVIITMVNQTAMLIIMKYTFMVPLVVTTVTFMPTMVILDILIPMFQAIPTVALGIIIIITQQHIQTPTHQHIMQVEQVELMMASIQEKVLQL